MITATLAAAVVAVGLVHTVPAAGAAPVKVKRITLTLVDDSRPTPANGTYPGAPDRTLETVVSYPTKKGKPVDDPLPLIVFATGSGGTATNYAPLYDHWVKAGYVVAAPTFPLSSENAPGGSTALDVANQPADVSFVVDEMVRLNRDTKSKVHGLIDTKKIGIAGKSLGAITVMQAGYNPAEVNPKVKAVVALTGAAGNGADFGAIHTPLLLVHGDADTTVPISGSQDAYTNASPPKFFITLPGATHGSAFQGGSSPNEKIVNTAPAQFFDIYLKGKDALLEQLRKTPGTESEA